jgi:DNA anti-recombination protein RmuC
MFKAWNNQKKQPTMPIVETTVFDEERVKKLEKTVKQIEDQLAELEYDQKTITQACKEDIELLSAAVAKQILDMTDAVTDNIKFNVETVFAKKAESDKSLVAFLNKILEAAQEYKNQTTDPF